MKRLHVHLSVPSLAQSIGFYTQLFGAPPTVEKSDYAKWMLDDPRVNFAISARGAKAGLNHLGIQVESADELEAVRTRAAKADRAGFAEAGANCCYARSDKYWVRDPQGVAWETFHTLGEIPLFGTDAANAAAPAPHQAAAKAQPAACCA